MPITVRNDLPASSLYGAAYLAGLGQYAQRKRAEDLQWAELAQREAGQRRALDAQLYSQAASQAFNRQQNALDRQMRFGLADRELQRRMQEGAVERQHQLARDQAAFANQEARDMRMLDRQWAMGTELAMRQAEDDRRGLLMKQYESGQLTLDRASQLKLQKLRSDMSAVRGAGNLTPQDKTLKLQELDAQFWDVMGNPSPQLPGEREVPFSEKVRRYTFQEPVVTPDGKFMGYRNWTSSNRNGVEQLDSVFEPFKPPTGTGATDPEQKRWETHVGKFIGKTKAGADGESKVPFTAEDIAEEWFKEQKARELVEKRMSGKADLPGVIPLEAVLAEPPGMAFRLPGQKGVFVRDPSVEAGYRPTKWPGQAEDTTPPLLKRLPPTAPAAPAKPPTQPQNVPDQMWEDFISQLPIASSVQAAEAAGPGTYRLPDGRVYQVTE